MFAAEYRWMVRLRMRLCLLRRSYKGLLLTHVVFDPIEKKRFKVIVREATWPSEILLGCHHYQNVRIINSSEQRRKLKELLA